MYYKRIVEKILSEAVKTFPAVVVSGSRQSGKTIINESEEKWQVNFEEFKLKLRDRVETGLKNRTHFLLPFYGELGSTLKERLKKHKSERFKFLRS